MEESIKIQVDKIIDASVGDFLEMINSIAENGHFRKNRRLQPAFELLRPANDEFYEYAYFERSLEWYTRDILINQSLMELFHLAGIECIEFRKESNQQLLLEINSFLGQYYDKIRREVKGQELKNQLSFTLITKILMGTLGCVPAYDRYFIAGIKKQKVTTGNYNLKSIMKLVDFYEKNSVRLEPVREKMEVDGMPYPQMKMLDMGFWQIGFELDKVFSKKDKMKEVMIK